MSEFKHYKIDYIFNGQFKSFYICTIAMDDSLALYWAAVDCGIRPIPKYRLAKAASITMNEARSLGITEIEWDLG